MTSWIGNLADAGQLTGLEGARQGHGLDVRPYVSGGRDTGDGQFTGGLDVVKNLTPNLNASITVNTDFAETEADIRQVNLTRFPLFFPEKRTFFLEGAGVFDVAGLARRHRSASRFSRGESAFMATRTWAGARCPLMSARSSSDGNRITTSACWMSRRARFPRSRSTGRTCSRLA